MSRPDTSDDGDSNSAGLRGLGVDSGTAVSGSDGGHGHGGDCGGHGGDCGGGHGGW